MTPQVAADEELPADAASPGRARSLMRRVVGALGHDDLIDAAQLAVSEIVTNALVHAGTPMRLRILRADKGFRVELLDGSSRMPHQRGFGAAAPTGRGLHLVEQLVTRWGAHRLEDGKVVWFEIRDDAALEEETAGPQGRDRDDDVLVQLTRMPLLMHQAWQEHAAALLRELMLVRLDSDPDALLRHALASEALSLLDEQVPTAEVGLEPEALMENATEPRVSMPRLRVRIPRASLPGFDALDDLLDEAVELAEQGLLLAPPTQPELEAMRLWICRQVKVQAAGGDPDPWQSATAELLPRARLPEAHDVPAEVSSSPRPQVAADDANRILAVSAPALALLGYESEDQLVGRRLLAIVPERFHQAHIAGFTLFLVNGRDPLLHQEVTIPVLRRDGTEVELSAVIRSRTLPGGRYLFTAELGEPG